VDQKDTAPHAAWWWLDAAASSADVELSIKL
jgi:hypothetical protein